VCIYGVLRLLVIFINAYENGRTLMDNIFGHKQKNVSRTAIYSNKKIIASITTVKKSGSKSEIKEI
jgi:hypothetical protein